MVVRNEADILPTNIRYHAAQGITEFRIVDNGSSDATSDRLRELARTIRIRWTRNEGPIIRQRMVTGPTPAPIGLCLSMQTSSGAPAEAVSRRRWRLRGQRNRGPSGQLHAAPR